MTLNARFNLKCAWQTARLTYVCCGFRIRPYAQVQPEHSLGEWTEGLAPPPCGQLTRCFSAVAELLVIIIIAAYQYLKVNYYIKLNYYILHFLLHFNQTIVLVASPLQLSRYMGNKIRLDVVIDILILLSSVTAFAIYVGHMVWVSAVNVHAYFQNLYFSCGRSQTIVFCHSKNIGIISCANVSSIP